VKRLIVVLSTASLVMGGLALATPAEAAPVVHTGAQSLCTSAWSYSITGRGADSQQGVGAAQSDHNGTASAASVTFTSTTSGTVSATSSGSSDIALSIEVASIASHFGISATVSKTVTVGNSITISVPAGKSGNGQYGAWRAYVTGLEKFTNNNCVVTTSSAKNIYAPYKVGWNTWISA
jgi:hypothetical protein